MNIVEQVIFEDEDIIVLSKPAGVVVTPADSVKSVTLQEEMKEYLKSKPWPAEWQSQVPDTFSDEFGTPEEIFEQRNGVVHRLDKETSGVLVFAKHPGSLVALLKAFKEREVQKEYLCLAHGKFTQLNGSISLPIGRSRRDRKRFDVVPDGRVAETEYHVEQYFPHILSDKVIVSVKERLGKEKMPDKWRNFAKSAKMYQGFSLVRALPHTGRTHQIRVHMAALSHPLVGDDVYVGKKRVVLDAAWCSRHFLHAAKITFMHPRTKKEVSFESELPQDLQAVFNFLE